MTAPGARRLLPYMARGVLAFGMLAPASGAFGADAQAPAAAKRADAALEPLDYATLSHTLSIDSLRAGSHDSSGHNEYYFTVTMYGLLNSSEERNLEFAKRKKVTTELGNFGAAKIDALAVWRPDEKAKDFKEFKVDGKAIRELAAKTMTEFKVQEGDVAIQVEAALMRKNKRFVFFGEDMKVATTSYYPIPPTKFDTPIRTNQGLAIADDKGTLVRLTVRYEKPATAAKAAPPQAEPLKKP